MDWSVVLVLVLAVSVCADDRWIWRGSHNPQDNNVRTPRILSRVNSYQDNNVGTRNILGRVNSYQDSNVRTPKILSRVNSYRDNSVRTPKILGRVNYYQSNNVQTPKVTRQVNSHPTHHQMKADAQVPDITTFGHLNQPSHPINSRAQISTSFPPFFPFMPFLGFMGLQGLPVTQPQLQQQMIQWAALQALLSRPPKKQVIQRATTQALLSRPPNHALPLPGDGTTKTRVTEDTAFHIKSVVEDGDKYTTIDKHQSQYKDTQPLPRPSEELLGGLDPREVFYADEDLLIIKGGGFNSDKFEEPRQTLDDSDDSEDPEFGQGTRVFPQVLPNPDLEYNGNIPAILPPPSSDQALIGQTEDQSHFAVFMESPSRINTMTIFIPYVYYLENSRNSYNTRDISSQLIEAEPNYNSLYMDDSASEFSVLQSLSGDTAVNYLDQRPSVNPHAELIGNDQQEIAPFRVPIPICISIPSRI